ncbi:ankyrin repeat containing protein [Penicillium soppii]|uniref:ankyrin repeat containing protein n=1 Tax=Penicillium soppii TaxID=69789 RepID=UPI002546E648|nr:ankyrin repeat containing protein [Penicillium soppii]KAJ5864914.1 ankyrin repeat containing protein [Penicillium soppii]
MKDNFGRTILHLAVIYDDLIAVARLAREELVDVDCPEHLGETPLMLAAKLHAGDQPNNVKIFKCLLSRSKAMVDQREQRGQSVLSHAVNTSNTDLIQCLSSLASDQEHRTAMESLHWLEQGPEGSLKSSKVQSLKPASHAASNISAPSICEGQL